MKTFTSISGTVAASRKLCPNFGEITASGDTQFSNT